MSVLSTAVLGARQRLRVDVVPRASTSLAVSAGSVVSLAPSLLPRTPAVQGVLTGILVSVLWGLTTLVRRHTPAAGSGTRTVAAAASAVLLVGSVASADHWQNSLRAAMTLPGTDAAYWVQTGCWAAAVCLAGFVAARATVAGARRPGWRGATVLGVVFTTLCWFVVPASTAAAAQHFRSTNVEGERFLAGTSDPRAVRTYAGLDTAPDVTGRAALAVRELDRAGGFARGHVVVAVPTGSGWIDGEAARGLERRFDGDVAIVGQQYSYAPSWVTFLFDRGDAAESARALFSAVSAHIAALPAEARPALHVYGQSLGSVGGSAIFENPAATDATCSALWAGPPAGVVDTDGAVVLANSSDPVVWWSPALLARAPDLSRVRVDAPVPHWIPFVSFVQTTVDLVFARDTPTGHGHRYGADQGLRMPGCGSAAETR
ncbi:alpha/beta-hydrolase family protein [Prescottella subtropica]|uniref:alpha/beta-hydrolase family protein n=1 Tax=Prescottella subtropica TaxID=2545757 RepID=UPI0010F929B5|nr:alpha/beta-hydrolase family protein [Prescottella subtropica]